MPQAPELQRGLTALKQRLQCQREKHPKLHDSHIPRILSGIVCCGLGFNFSKESEFYVILEEMRYLRLTLLQEGSWKDIIESNSW